MMDFEYNDKKESRYKEIKKSLWERWKGIYKDVAYEIAIDSSVDGDNCLAIFFYEKDMDGEYYASADITDDGFEASLYDAHIKARKIINEVMEDY